MDGSDEALLNQMFDVFVRDFSLYATELHGKPSNTDQQRALIRELIRAPAVDPEQFDAETRERLRALGYVE